MKNPSIWMALAVATSSAIVSSVDAAVVNWNLNLDIPATSERYARLYFTVAGSGNFTAGKFDAGIVLDRQTNGYEHMAATD